ncbi:MAG: DUF1266 domain-containing protein, partial [Anaerolineales bacterium]|nr:DUF1266 domain-containing protein [Anaerolineales bacterium]
NRCGKRFWAITTKVLMVLSVCAVVGNIVKQWPYYQTDFEIAFFKDTSACTIKLFDGNTMLYLDGGLAFGTSRKVKKELDANSDIKRIILDSSGGWIYEAQKLADLILQRRLDTYTIRGCSASAITPFLAGENRFMCERAEFGFRRYSPSERFRDYLARENWAFYQSRGVTKDFQEKIFTADPNDFWYPSDLELYNGGMIHAVLKLTDILPMEDAIVFSYDTSRKPSKMSSDITDEQIKRWILGCSGPLWEFNRDGFDSLGTWKAQGHRAAELTESLSDGWDIENRNDILRDLYWLSQDGGHRDNFARDGRRVCEMTDEQLDAFLEQYKTRPQKCNDYRIAHQHYKELGDKGILGWDLSRYMCLCQWGYICGWLDEETAWELMVPIARELQQTFGSWEELGQNYLIGRHYWSLTHVQKDKKGFDEAFWRLTEMPSSPWNKYPWDLDLSGAYAIVPAPTPPQEVVEEPTPAVVEPTDEPEPVIPAIEMPVIPELVFSTTNTLSDLQKSGPVLVVPDDFNSIQAAIDTAAEGDTILIKAGDYNESLSLANKNNIRIVGQSTADVILRSTEPNIYCVLLIENCRDAVLSDVTILEPLKGLKNNSASLFVKKAEFKITGCRISNPQGIGIACFAGARGVIKNTLIESCLSNGISVAESRTDITLSDCCIKDNKTGGLSGYAGANIVIRNTLFEKNGNGVMISQQGTKAALT